MYAYLYTQLFGDASYAADAGVVLGTGRRRPRRMRNLEWNGWRAIRCRVFTRARAASGDCDAGFRIRAEHRRSRRTAATIRASVREHLRFSDESRARSKSTDDAYVLVGHIDADGTLRVIFPLDPQDDGLVRGLEDLPDARSLRGVRRLVPPAIHLDRYSSRRCRGTRTIAATATCSSSRRGVRCASSSSRQRVAGTASSWPTQTT